MIFRVHALRADYNHADSHIKCPEHFVIGNIAELLHHAKNWKLRPRATVDFDRNAIREYSWNVFKKSAAGDVCEPFDNARIELRTDLR